MRVSISETLKLGPLSLTVSKSGLTVGVGTKGARVSLNSRGQARLSLGAKGLRYTKTKKIT